MNRVVHGDAREVAENLPPVDLVVTDPPYGIGFNSGRYRNREYESMPGDEDIGLTRWLLQVLPRLMKPDTHAYVFTRWDTLAEVCGCIPEPLELANVLVWDKGVHGMGDLKGNYAPRHELIMFLRRGDRLLNHRSTDFLSFKDIRLTGEKKYHPTQKPVALLRFLVEISSDEGDLVLDPFMGSGSTLVAAKQVNRRYIGVEIEERYVRAARCRLSQETLHAWAPGGEGVMTPRP